MRMYEWWTMRMTKQVFCIHAVKWCVLPHFMCACLDSDDHLATNYRIHIDWSGTIHGDRLLFLNGKQSTWEWIECKWKIKTNTFVTTLPLPMQMGLVTLSVEWLVATPNGVHIAISNERKNSIKLDGVIVHKLQTGQRKRAATLIAARISTTANDGDDIDNDDDRHLF